MIRQTLLTGWDAMRWVRLAMGVFIGIQAFQMHDTLAGLIAGFFLFQAITNTGCCGSRGCAVPTQKLDKKEIDSIPYETVK